jgi:lipocalin
LQLLGTWYQIARTDRNEHYSWDAGIVHFAKTRGGDVTLTYTGLAR